MKRLFDDFINGSTPILYPLVMMGFTAALAVAMPMAVRFMAKQFLSHRHRIADTLRPLWPHDHRIFPDDSPFAGRKNLQSGLHPGGKEFSVLRSKNPTCETAGWIAIL